ncbi:MAG: YgfZ/GcvT domain-containing protein [Phototrophicaceae bacterium]
MTESLQEHYRGLGAQLAPDGIPLHFGDLLAEYEAALNAAVLMDRSHEARLLIDGSDRAVWIDRMSTNAIVDIQPGQVRATLYTNANARVLDRVEILAQADDSLLMLGGPGRGPALTNYLRRNIFFNDRVALQNLAPATHQLALHGPSATSVLARLLPAVADVPLRHGLQGQIDGAAVTLLRLPAFSGQHWVLVMPVEAVSGIFRALLDVGAQPAGGLTYNTLRIRAGVPGVGRELTDAYIPLELGLWDEVSFTKGCYTGQEILARMESRERLARVLVRLNLPAMLDAPQPLFFEGRAVGELTSSVTAPDGQVFATGVVKVAQAVAGVELRVADAAEGPLATVGERLGTPPPYLNS